MNYYYYGENNKVVLKSSYNIYIGGKLLPPTVKNLVSDISLDESTDGFVENIEPDKMPAEDLRIEALKRAIDIAKLMSNVTTQDVINIASKIADYISNT